MLAVSTGSVGCQETSRIHSWLVQLRTVQCKYRWRSTPIRMVVGGVRGKTGKEENRGKKHRGVEWGGEGRNEDMQQGDVSVLTMLPVRRS